MAAPASSTVPLQKYRRLRIVTFILLAVSVFLGIALFAQSTNQGAKTAAESIPEMEQQGPDDAAYVRNDPEDPMALGDPDAPIVLSEWTDLRCPFCAVFNRDTLPAIVEEYVDTGKVRIEVNDVSYFGDESTDAAIAARAAGNQGMYFEYLHTVYEAAPEDGHPDMPRDKLIGFAKTAGIPDLDRFEQDLDEPELRKAVETNTAQAQQLGVSGVPFFVAGGQAISGAQPIETFREFLDGALAEAGQ
ncbi:thioredoxin domain-containing protein [Leucobacter ruminantium]|uniref:Thioredoxin domain-containing protein n=1 Tax=Leucobacter ruminantium TaxID=1289170 RepID=A0A939RY50_9MICO|nr:thioredoxin domain-containing protein [Leucobacter ruminantium]MBO1804501.1 thioredoxin domain-containing protein [Leucobacter ruminantium]